jgi:hypothetical protein
MCAPSYPAIRYDFVPGAGHWKSWLSIDFTEQDSFMRLLKPLVLLSHFLSVEHPTHVTLRLIVWELRMKANSGLRSWGFPITVVRAVCLLSAIFESFEPLDFCGLPKAWLGASSLKTTPRAGSLGRLGCGTWGFWTIKVSHSGDWVLRRCLQHSLQLSYAKFLER